MHVFNTIYILMIQVYSSFCGNSTFVEYLHDLISCRPSVCIYYQGVPVSWSIVRYDGVASYAYTIKEYRNKMLFNTCYQLVNRQLYQMGEQPCGYVDKENKPALNLAINSLHLKIIGEVGHRFYRPGAAKL